MIKKDRVGRWPWMKVVMSKRGPRSPTTRLVLSALSMVMNSDGSKAFQSAQTLADRTGLAERCVRKHLRVAVRDGWLDEGMAGRNGQGWALRAYAATVPASVE